MDWSHELDEEMLSFLTRSKVMRLQIWRMDSRWGTLDHGSQFLFPPCIRIKHECFLPQDVPIEWKDIFPSS